jgi:hypothetical protein
VRGAAWVAAALVTSAAVNPRAGLLYLALKSDDRVAVVRLGDL